RANPDGYPFRSSCLPVLDCRVQADQPLAMMPLPADYHMHTPLCRHATGEPTELAAQAIKVGLSEIGFSEHNPMMRDDWDDWHMLQANLDEYVEKVQKARKDHPSLTIKLAMEVD